MVTEKTNLQQLFTMLAGLCENTELEEFTTQQIQVGIREKQRAGKEMAAFIRNGFRVQVADFFRETGEFTVMIPALARPTHEELRAKFSWIREKDGIERDTSPIETVTFKLGTVLGPDDDHIGGPEYEHRIAPKHSVCLGYQHAAWLVEHQDEFPELMALVGKVYIDFPGLVVVSADGDRLFPCLGRYGRRWCLHWFWVRSGLRRNGRVAVSGK